MKKIIASFLLVMSAPCFGQAIASRRYAELMPEQYVFGPLTAIAPFNSAPNHSITTDAQIQPTSLITANDNFSSTSEFTTAFSAGSPSFTVSANQGTIVIGASDSLAAVDINATLPAPGQMVQTTVNTTGATIIGVGIFSGSQGFFAEFNRANGYIGVCFFDGSTYHYSSGVHVGTPSTSWRIGFSLIGNTGVVWQDTGNGWAALQSFSSATWYNFETVGNLTGWHSGWYVYGGAATYAISAFKAGAFGGVGVRDISLVTYADGRPYLRGSVAYFTATTCGPTGSCYDGVYTYGVLGGALTEIGEIFNNRGGTVVPDLASHLVYDSGANEYRYLVGGWGTSNSPPTWYGAWSKSTLDPLAGGVSVVTAATQLTSLGSPVWDAHMACSQWNYSALTCGNWILGANNSFNNSTQRGYATTSDPSSNSFTSFGSAGTSWGEGERIYRTAAGPSGVKYEIGYSNRGATGYGNENTTTFTANTSSFSPLGNITAQMPVGPNVGAGNGSGNPPHVQLLSYANTEYLISFTDTLWGTTGNTMGNWVVASAPKYSAQSTYPQYVPGASSFASASAASITSSAVTVSAGDLVVAYCRGGTTTAASVVLSSSVSIGSFTGVGFDLITSGSGTGYGEAFYLMGATSGGSSTFTCTPSVASTFQGITVMVFHPGNLTSVDYTAIANQTGSSLKVYTTPTFSTTGAGLIVVCGDGLFGAEPFMPGFIGPYAASFSQGLVSGAAACESTVTTAAQASITANMGSVSGNSGAQWGGAILSFK